MSEARVELALFVLEDIQAAMAARDEVILRSALKVYPPLPACPKCSATPERIEITEVCHDTALVDFDPCGCRMATDLYPWNRP